MMFDLGSASDWPVSMPRLSQYAATSAHAFAGCDPWRTCRSHARTFIVVSSLPVHADQRGVEPSDRRLRQRSEFVDSTAHGAA